MVDDVKDIIETAESKASQEVLDRARLARERREAEQRKRLDELRAHAAAAQAQREKRDEDRRRRQADQRARDDDRRLQVEERKRAIWEASVSRREALVQRERDRSERLERQRAARSAPRPAFAFGSSTPRLLEPLDSGGFFWAARSTNPIDQMNFFESLAASTTNVMFASAPLTRRASALQLDSSDTDNKDEPDRTPQPQMWSSVARRRTDLVPTLPAPRAPGRAYSMTRLDRLPHSPATHHSRTQTRSGDTTPGSRPGSALSTAGVVRRPATAPRKPRPASIAGTGVNTPRGGIGDTAAQSAATTPTVSRDSTMVSRDALAGGGDAPRRVHSAPRRPRPASLYASSPGAPGEGKPPLHRKPKPSKEHDKTPRGKSMSASPRRALSPAPAHSKEPSVDKEVLKKIPVEPTPEKTQVSAVEVTHKLEALQIHNGHDNVNDKQIIESQETQHTQETKPEAPEVTPSKPIEQKEEQMQTEQREAQKIEQKEAQKIEQKEAKPVEKKEEKREEKKEPSQEKTDDNEMTASMTRRITTEEQAKAALAERRRRAREELERQAELERQRLQREAEEEAERQRLEEERQRREEIEARELAQLQRSMEEEKLRKAIEAQQQLEREEAERKVREEAERQAKLREEEEKRKAAEEAEKLRKEEAEREEKERLARKQRVEAIMARTRLRKAEEDKKQQENKQNLPNQAQPTPTPAPAVENAPTENPVSSDNGANNEAPSDSTKPVEGAPTNNGAPIKNEALTNNGAPVESMSVNNLTQVESGAPIDSVSVNNGAPIDSVDNGKASMPDNGNIATGDLLGFTSQPEASKVPDVNASLPAPVPVPEASETNSVNNGNLTADLLGLSQLNNEDKLVEQPTTKTIDNATTNQLAPTETNNGNVHATHVGQPAANVANMSANFIQNEIATNESQTKMADKLLDDDFTTHNGHGHNHPLTLQNAI